MIFFYAPLTIKSDACLSYSRAKKLQKAFKEGREEVTDELQSGRSLFPQNCRRDLLVVDPLHSEKTMNTVFIFHLLIHTFL